MHGYAALLGTTALATKEFRTSRQPDADGRYVRIVGRKSGIVDWFLSLIGIDTTTVFEVYHDHIRFKSSSLSGSMTTLLPMNSISATSTGFFKPVLLLVVGILLLPILVGIVPIVLYFYQKSLLVAVESNSGRGAMIAFKRSVVEGVRVEAEQAAEVISIVNALVLNQSPAATRALDQRIGRAS